MLSQKCNNYRDSGTCVLWGVTRVSQSGGSGEELTPSQRIQVFLPSQANVWMSAQIKGHWLFLSCPSLFSVCPKPAPCLVACSPVFPFLDTLSNTDAVPFYMTVLFIYFYVSALLLGFCLFFFCLHKRKVSFLEKPNTSVFFGTITLCVYICQLFLFPKH